MVTLCAPSFTSPTEQCLYIWHKADVTVALVIRALQLASEVGFEQLRWGLQSLGDGCEATRVHHASGWGDSMAFGCLRPTAVWPDTANRLSWCIKSCDLRPPSDRTVQGWFGGEWFG